jgi:hypothetical protein
MTIPPQKKRAGSLTPRLLRLLGFTAVLSILLILFSLLVTGLPDTLTKKISGELLKSGIPLRFDSIRLSLHRGWVLENTVFYSTSPDDLKPLFETPKLYVRAWPDSWKNLKNATWDMTLYATESVVSLGNAWQAALPETSPFHTVDRMKIPLTAQRGRIHIEEALLNWGGLHLILSGEILLDEPPVKKPSGTDWQRQAAEAAAFINSLQFAVSPVISVDFAFNRARPREASIDMSATAGGLLYRDRTYRALDAHLSLEHETVSLTGLRLEERPGEEIFLTGSSPLDGDPARLSVTNSLSADSLLNLLPESWKELLQRDPARVSGPLRFSAELGPAPLRELPSYLQADIAEARINRENLTLDPLTFQLIRDGNLLRITNLQARANGGPLSGSFTFNLESFAWKAFADAQCPLASLDALADEDLILFLQRFDFPNEQPAVRLTLSQSAPGEPLFISGTLEGSGFTCGGVPIDHFQSSMLYSNEVLDLSLLTASHDQKRFDGSVQVDFKEGISRFDAAGSFPPTNIQRVLAPEETTPLNSFRFNGPVYIEGSGRIDYRHGTNHLFSGTFYGEDIDYNGFTSRRFNSVIQADGTVLTFTNATANLFHGTLQGSAEFDLFTGDETAPYRLNIQGSGIDLARLIKEISDKPPEDIRGEISGTLRLSADAAAGFWDSVNGAGQLHIRNGQLTNLPLFGGLSRLIRSSFAGFNLFSLNTFYAGYQLRDGAFHSNDAQLGGTLFSARGQGSWVPETGLDFLVKAEPLRQTRESKEWFQLHLWAAEALKLGTSPFFQFLEFRLEGPLNQPTWRFVNLPEATSSLLQRRLPFEKQE